MLIVDAQVHIWDGGNPPPHHAQEVYGASHLLRDMEIAGVDRAILVPPTWDPAGNAPSLQAAVDHPDRFVVMGHTNVTNPANAGSLAAFVRQPGMLGVRQSFNTPKTRAALVAGDVNWFWAEAEALDIPLMILAPGLLPWVAEIADRHPNLRLIVDHLAIPRGAKAPAAFEHWPELIALSRFGNVAVKACGLPGYVVGEAFPYPSMSEPLQRAFDAFGPDRLFWGTDLSRMKAPYRECVEMMTEGLPWLKGDDLAGVMGGGLCRWLGWETAPAMGAQQLA